MNEWVRRSLTVANSPGYLDKLTEVYPAVRPPPRPLPNSAKQEIARLYGAKDRRGLVVFLFELRQRGHPFPYEHPYASLLRSYPRLVEQNPDIVRQIADSLLAVPVEEIMRGCERPAEINRIMGASFQAWIHKYFPQRGIPVLPESEFDHATQLAFLNASDAALLHYVRDKLGYDYSLGRDFLAKVGKMHIMGEARFLSTYGGSQSRDLRSTLEFAKMHKMNLTTVAVIDGIAWFDKRYMKLLQELKAGEPTITALLLEDFLSSFR